MTPSLSATMGPPPFRYQPSAGAATLRSPAFSRFFKCIATVLVAGTAGWFIQLWIGGKVSGGAVSILSWFLAAIAMMGATWWSIIRSVTSLDATELNQSWLWHKKMALRELAYARLIRVRGLDWLVAPRLYLRSLDGKFAVFYAADPRMVDEFGRLAAQLNAFRGPRR